jgi:PTS system beta-glucosides-specific IIC component
MATDKSAFTVFGIPASVQNYTSSVLPVLLSVWVMSYIEKFFNKYLPPSLRTIFAPTITIFIMLPLSLIILAPAGGLLGQYVSKGLLSFGNVGGFVAVGLIAALWEFLVMSGMHIILVVTLITVIISTGHESVVGPAALCATFAAMGMALGAALRLKNKEEKSLSIGYFIAGFLGGVTEPALYGVGFKYKRPFLGMMIGGGLGGLYAGLTHVSLYILGASNFLSILSYAGGGTANLVNGIISCAIALVGSVIATYIIGIKSEGIVE